MIKESGISKQDQASNPQAILDVIGFMTDNQQMNEEDHAFSKFTNFEETYADQLGAETVSAQSTENGTNVRTSPLLPKRPISPTKPPRRTNSKGEGLSAKVEKNEKEDSFSDADVSVQEAHHRNNQSLDAQSDSQSLSKIPSLKSSVKPAVPLASSKPAIPVKPNFSKNTNHVSQLSTSSPLSDSSSDAYNGTRQELQEDTLLIKQGLNSGSVKLTTGQKPAKPPVPARPSHTLGPSSIDVTTRKF